MRAGRGRAWNGAGISFETDAYVVDEHLIWGATARILEDLLERLDGAARRWSSLAARARRRCADPVRAVG